MITPKLGGGAALWVLQASAARRASLQSDRRLPGQDPLLRLDALGQRQAVLRYAGSVRGARALNQRSAWGLFGAESHRRPHRVAVWPGVFVVRDWKSFLSQQKSVFWLFAALLVAMLVGYWLSRPSHEEPADPGAAVPSLAAAQSVAKPIDRQPNLPAPLEKNLEVEPKTTELLRQMRQIGDNRALFNKALSSDDPKVIWAGLKAEGECPPMRDGDLSGLEAMVLAQPLNPQEAKLRMAAAKAVVQACGGFGQQKQVGDEVHLLEAKLTKLTPQYDDERALQKMYLSGANMTADAKRDWCRALGDASGDPLLFWSLNFGIGKFFLTKAIAAGADGALRAGWQAAAMERMACSAAGNCGRLVASQAMACALGQCGPPPMFDAQGRQTSASDFEAFYDETMKGVVRGVCDE